MCIGYVFVADKFCRIGILHMYYKTPPTVYKKTGAVDGFFMRINHYSCRINYRGLYKISIIFNMYSIYGNDNGGK